MHFNRKKKKLINIKTKKNKKKPQQFKKFPKKKK